MVTVEKEESTPN